MQALAERDEQTLEPLEVTREEFCTIVWPELPSSRIENLTCDWVWESFEPSDLAGRRRILARHGGKTYSLVRLRFAGGTTEYRTYTVHRDVRVIVVDEAGETKELKLFGSILERDGQFELMSFITD